MLCRLEGPARLLMTGERTALNLLQTLSGTATLSKRYAEAVEGTTLKILDTRKTLPGLRNAQKYAVKIGGCHNHRIGLYDGILIKENHIRAIGSITLAVEAARNLGRQVMIEVEVESLEELDEALSAGVQRILIDEFTPAMREAAVRRSRGRAELEVSGNVRIEDLPEIARSGVDYVSIGSLTKHLRAVDLSMQVEIGAGS
jgi:nicotinate-nucleotide pyrophosphorylase (carboxylating)